MRNLLLAPLAAVVALSAGAGCVTRTVYVVDDRDAPQPAPSGGAVAQADPVPEDEAGIAQVDQFYEPLSPYGSWVMYPGYGRVFVPSQNVVGAGYRPYTHGHWEYTEWGWTWADHHPFGWATGHYGRWFYDTGYGWMWVPGTVWSPAWVSWRTGGAYVGWAPMPPGSYYGASYSVYETSWVYVYSRHIGSPYASSVLIVGPGYATCYRETYPVYTTTVVYGRTYYRGPDYDRVTRDGARVVHRPIRETERERAVTRPPAGTAIARGRDRDRDGERTGTSGTRRTRDGRDDGSDGRGGRGDDGGRDTGGRDRDDDRTRGDGDRGHGNDSDRNDEDNPARNPRDEGPRGNGNDRDNNGNGNNGNNGNNGERGNRGNGGSRGREVDGARTDDRGAQVPDRANGFTSDGPRPIEPNEPNDFGPGRGGPDGRGPRALDDGTLPERAPSFDGRGAPDSRGPRPLDDGTVPERAPSFDGRGDPSRIPAGNGDRMPAGVRRSEPMDRDPSMSGPRTPSRGPASVDRMPTRSSPPSRNPSVGRPSSAPREMSSPPTSSPSRSSSKSTPSKSSGKSSSGKTKGDSKTKPAPR